MSIESGFLKDGLLAELQTRMSRTGASLIRKQFYPRIWNSRRQSDPYRPHGPSQWITEKKVVPSGTCKLRILMDPLGPSAGSMRSVWIWLGPRVQDTHFIHIMSSPENITFIFYYV